METFSDVIRVPQSDGVDGVALIPAGVWWTPEGFQAAGIGASWALSKELAESGAAEDEIVSRLRELGQGLEGRLFPASEVVVSTVTNHRYAWPRRSAEHATRVANWEQRPPIVFAGDWTW